MAASSAILTFHSIDTSGSVISFDPALFRARMEALAQNGPPVVPLLECLRRPGTVALTFDDGFANFATGAWPVLRSLGLPATLFVVSGSVGTRNDWKQPSAEIPDLPLLDWPQLRELAREGLELGAHSHTHPDLTAIEPRQLAEEFELPLRLIEERAGTKPKAFAYPYGQVNAGARAQAARLYQAACGTVMGYWSGETDAHATPRLDAYYLQGAVGPAEVLSASGRRWMAARAFARKVREGLSASR
ncbi:MAG: polysaccharide deacetylase family protein [Acidobacteriota bacterium]